MLKHLRKISNTITKFNIKILHIFTKLNTINLNKNFLYMI